MIGVKGQYLIKFKIGSKDDFIKEPDIRSFLLVEEAGNVLPSFELEFELKDSSILNLLNQGNILEVALGKDETDLMNIRLMILHQFKSRMGANRYNIKITGLSDAMEYLSNCNMTMSESKSGVEVIKDTVGTYFTPEFNIETSQDSQVWRQYNVPDKVHVSNVWLHSYIPNSFLAVGITSDSRFVLKDVKKAVSDMNNYQWKLSSQIAKNETPSTKDISLDGDYVHESETGFINQWFGYEKTKSVFDIDTGMLESTTPTLQTMMALSKKFDRAKTINSRRSEFEILNENVHSNYWKAYLQNITNLAIFSSNRLECTYSKTYRRMRVLDVVMFSDTEISSQAAVESYSGLYLISRISRHLANKTLRTTVQLCREASGSMKGDIR